jgi:hypothetical protein
VTIEHTVKLQSDDQKRGVRSITARIMNQVMKKYEENEMWPGLSSPFMTIKLKLSPDNGRVSRVVGWELIRDEKLGATLRKAVAVEADDTEILDWLEKDLQNNLKNIGWVKEGNDGVWTIVASWAEISQSIRLQLCAYGVKQLFEIKRELSDSTCRIRHVYKGNLIQGQINGRILKVYKKRRRSGQLAVDHDKCSEVVILGFELSNGGLVGSHSCMAPDSLRCMPTLMDAD